MNSENLTLPFMASSRNRQPALTPRGLVGSVLRRWHRDPAVLARTTAIPGNNSFQEIAQSLLDSLREPLAFVDRRSGRWLLTGGNAALGQLLARPQTSLTGLCLANILVQVPGRPDPVEQALGRTAPTRLRSQVIDARGGLHRVTVRVDPVGPVGPNLTGKTGRQAMIYFDPLEAEVDALRDATRRLHETENRLRRQTAELDRMQRELDAFGAMLSHDLRMPLRTIDEHARQLIETDAAAGPSGPVRDRLMQIRGAGAQMNGMIDALRTLSIVTGRPVDRIPLDLGDVAREALTELRRAPADAAAAPVHRRLQLHIAPSMVVQADPMLMRLLLTNLLGNAIKFTSLRSEPVIELGVSSDTGRRVFHVRDNGIGFDITHARGLFAMFQRLPGADAWPGHGIGLAVCRRVVRRFGGEIWASGLPGEGACFYFTIPDQG